METSVNEKLEKELEEMKVENKKIIKDQNLYLLKFTSVMIGVCFLGLIPSLLGYSGISYYLLGVSLAFSGAIYFILSAIYVRYYLMVLVVPCVLLVHGLKDYLINEQIESQRVEVLEVDVINRFLGLTSSYRISTPQGVFNTDNSQFFTGQHVIITKYETDDRLAGRVSVCDEHSKNCFSKHVFSHD